MGWQERSVVDERREFVLLASLEGANIAGLCRRFGVSRETGHLWLRRFRAGDGSLEDHSCRPLSSPRRTPDAMEGHVLRVRDAHPAWGARKIAAALGHELAHELGHQGIMPPAASTVHAILNRHGRIVPGSSGRVFGSFERAVPNELWQMDFKGKIKLADGSWLHPLTVIDDHSRFAIGLTAFTERRGETVQAALERALRIHGLPQAFYVDNGAPWGTSGGTSGRDTRWTRFRVWLLKLGIETIYATPYHPQGRGKNERFHRSLNAEVFSMARLADVKAAQAALERWRHVYNYERPHEALDFARPADRYRSSPKPFPERLPEPEYDDGEILRRVGTTKAFVSFKGRLWRVPDAFIGETLAIRPRTPNGHYAICFGAHDIATIDLNANQT
jgi:transposase InsO family protein